MIFKHLISTLILVSILFSKFPDAVGYNGMVVSSNQYASDIGIEILKKGGNAIDAAIGVSFALAVVHPGAGNIGGGGFMVIRSDDGQVTTIDFREKAPSAAFKDMFLDDSLNVIPGKSWSTSLATGVPGSVSGMWLAHQKFGSVNWADIVRPSIKLAQYGFNLDPLNCSYLNSDYYKVFLSNDIESKNIFTKNEPFKIGEIFYQTDLANTLRRIAFSGEKGFYEGETAKNIVQCMKRTGGIITENDLRNYQAIERKPIQFEYKGYKIHSMPPPSSGGIALAGILNQLENIDLQSIPYHSADYIHYLVESERNVYADRSVFLGDSDFNHIAIDELISDEYSKVRWSEIDLIDARTSDSVKEGGLNYFESEETTHYSVVDKWGNAVSVTTTVNGWFGNGIVVDNSGFLLNNEMDDFSSKPGHPNKYGLIGNELNSIAPNKRMLSSMAPTIVENPDGDLFLVVGSPGGSTIITTVAQIILNLIDQNMSIKDAVEQSRFHHQWLPDLVYFEPLNFSKETLEALKDKGHNVAFRKSIGEANCIKIDKLKDKDKESHYINLYSGAADSRRGSSAVAY
jgi:gamma-glutamyltranspeptidase/glutathione hydrolase